MLIHYGRARVRSGNYAVSAALACGLSVAISTFASPGLADTVYLASPSSSEGYTRATGTVTDYSGAGLVLEAGGTARTFPADRVQRIETGRTKLQLEGDALFEAGDFTNALTAYTRAREQETRPWVRREITAQLVWCYQALGQATSAATQFLLLVRADPATPYFDCIPLTWYGSFQSRAMMPTAQRWLREETNPAAGLLGASYLLQTEHGGAAIARLHELAKLEDENIAQMARAQAWRSTIISVQESQVERWQEMVEEMPAGLRAGPHYLIGQGWARNQQWEKAALVLVRIPILYPKNRELTARALFDAAGCLNKLDRHDEANRLYRELIQKYPESPLVMEAESRLKSSPEGAP